MWIVMSGGGLVTRFGGVHVEDMRNVVKFTDETERWFYLLTIRIPDLFCHVFLAIRFITVPVHYKASSTSFSKPLLTRLPISW